MGTVVNRSLTIKSGQCHVHRYMRRLLDHISQGDIDPSFIATHRLPLQQAPRGYGLFTKGGWLPEGLCCRRTPTDAARSRARRNATSPYHPPSRPLLLLALLAAARSSSETSRSSIEQYGSAASE